MESGRSRDPILTPAPLILLPTGVGEAKPLTHDSINHLWARWLPDGKQSGVLGQRGRTWFPSLCGSLLSESKPRPISPEGVNPPVVLSPKGDFVASVGPDHKIYLYPIAGGEPVPVPGTEPDEAPTGWSADGRSSTFSASERFPPK